MKSIFTSSSRLAYMIGMASTLGPFAEKLAADFLQTKGYNILARNWRKPWGELDIVAHKDDTVIFIEVKANRYSNQGFEAEHRANHDKLQKVVRTARTYLLEKSYQSDQSWQVDVIAVVFDQESRSAKLKHFKNIEIS